MKKFLCFVLAAAMILSLVACGTTAQPAAEPAAEPAEAAAPKSMALIVSGPANDQGWNAVAVAGLEATAEKFGPVLKSYLTDKKEAEDIYDDVKDKYKAAEKAGTLTDAQATELLNAKFESAEKELAVKKKYLAEFRKILKPKKVYYAFDLASDKMSKIDGKDKDKD